MIRSGPLVNPCVSRNRESPSYTVLRARGILVLRCCAIYRTLRPSLFKTTIWAAISGSNGTQMSQICHLKCNFEKKTQFKHEATL
jgi:hypothetical protein